MDAIQAFRALPQSRLGNCTTASWRNSPTRARASACCCSVSSPAWPGAGALRNIRRHRALVAQQTREIGIRVAVGASMAAVVGMSMRSGAELLGGGIGVGLAASLGSVLAEGPVQVSMMTRGRSRRRRVGIRRLVRGLPARAPSSLSSHICNFSCCPFFQANNPDAQFTNMKSEEGGLPTIT